MTLCPAPVNTGYVFRIKKIMLNILKADLTMLINQLCTLLSDKNGNKITVEHILSACYSLEIDNIFIDLNSDEIPVCDGSSLDFVRELEESGFEEQSEFKQFIRIKKKN